MAFHVGQKVVCVDASREDKGIIGRLLQWLLGRDWPVEEQVYTVLRPFVVLEPHVGIELVEIKNVWLWERCFRRSRFRPLTGTKSSVSFTIGAPLDSEQFDNRRKLPAKVSS